MKSPEQCLVILIPGFPGDEHDSTCLPMQQCFVRNLKKLNPSLRIVVLSLQYPYHTKPYSLFNVEVIPFSLRTKNVITRIGARRNTWKKLEQVHRESSIIGLLSFWCSECAWIGKEFSQQYGLRHFCWLMGQDARKGNKFIDKIKPTSSELIALSDSLQTEFQKNYSIIPGFVIPAGIDIQQFPATPLSKDIDWMAAGSLIPLKQFELYLELIRQAVKRIPTMKAVLVGDGPGMKGLQQMAIEKGICDHIHFTGEIPHSETLKWMGRSKVFLHPSSYEGFSGVCLEALHARCQVVSFCHAMDRTIKNWHIVSTDLEMLQKGIDLLHDEAVPESSTPFLMENTVKQIMELYV